MNAILGISAYYHDSAAALLIDGKLIAAAQEERFTRRKHDASFPANAIAYVLNESGLTGADITHVAFYEKPFIKFERLLETYYAFAPRGLQSFLKAMPLWMKEKLYTGKILTKALTSLDIHAPLLFPGHHLSHAASAFFPSPFDEAAILTVDGVGEWSTTTLCEGEKNRISLLRELHFPHSLGLLYSAFTYYCGFKVNSGEYKLMGLAPYGIKSGQTDEYIRLIKEHLVDIREDGSFLLNMNYFEYATGLKMVNSKAWQKLFGIPPRQPESELTQEYMNLAYAIQAVTEEIMLKLVTMVKGVTGSDNLVLAGGVALNCVANGKLKESGLFKHIWIQPAAGDAGGAVGAAMAVWHIYEGKERIPVLPDGMSGAFLGPSFSEEEIENMIRRTGAIAEKLSENDLIHKVAALLQDGAIVGWFQGRMEFGPRALGNRSILADPRNESMQKKLNLEIKYRESFRPFAPAVLEEDVSFYFKTESVSPYMLTTVPLKKNQRYALPEDYEMLHWQNKLYTKRSSLQAVTHVDFSARIQTVSKDTNPRFYNLLLAFRKLTGCGVLVNTSFNIRGEPVVCSPIDAYNCFMSTGMDYLVIGNYLFTKARQPEI